MNTVSEFDQGETAEDRIRFPQDAVLIYEDLTTGLRGRQVFECAARLFPGAPHFNMAMWRFDLLCESTMREIILNEAATAAIVLLSAHGGRELPEVVMDWLARWLRQKSDEPCALIVSLDESSRYSASATRIFSLLQAGAREKDVELFPHFSAAIVAALDGIEYSSQSYSHWGINE